MTSPGVALPILPPHIEETVKAIAQLHADHHRGAKPSERLAERLTKIVGQPRFVAGLAGLVGLWLIWNTGSPLVGVTAPDPPPFNGLATLASISALFMTALILSTQRRDDKLAQLREQLTLELSIIAEQKAAKTIELLEEIRRDNPLLQNRVDLEAEAMSRPADPSSVLEVIKEAHADAESAAELDLGPEPTAA